jgi:replicative DNA helicase
MSTNIITPHDDEAELHLLSDIAQNQELMLPEFAVKLTEDHFFCQVKRGIWREMKADFLAGQPINRTAYKDRLCTGGAAAETWAIIVDVFGSLRYNTGNVGACRQVFDVLDKHRKLRAALAVSLEINEAIRRNDLETVERGAEVLVHKLSASTVKHGRNVNEILLDIMEEESATKVRGISFGLPWLTKNIGGFQNGMLTILAGPRGSGKSALGAQMMWHAAQHDKVQCSYHSHEMTDKTVVQRLLSLEGVRSSYWLNGGMNEYDKRSLARFNSREINRTTIVVYETLTRIEEVIAQMRLDVMRRGMKIAVVDLIQRVKGDRSQGREAELSGIAWELKSAALNLGIHIVAMSHLNKQLTARGSEDIENHADHMVIIGVEEGAEQNAERRRCLFKITKNRGGPSGIRCIHDFIGPHYRFVEVEETDEDLEPPKQESNGNHYRRRYNDE